MSDAVHDIGDAASIGISYFLEILSEIHEFYEYEKVKRHHPRTLLHKVIIKKT